MDKNPVAVIGRETVSAPWRYLVRHPTGHVSFPAKSKRAALELCQRYGWTPKWEGTKP